MQRYGARRNLECYKREFEQLEDGIKYVINNSNNDIVNLVVGSFYTYGTVIDLIEKYYKVDTIS